MNPSSPYKSNEWKGRHVLVTGANGFIGRWLVEALAARQANIYALVRPQTNGGEAQSNDTIKIVSGDIADLGSIFQIVHDLKIETVYHLAALNTNIRSNVSPFDLFETNLRGTYNILDACWRMPYPVSVIVSSSKEVENCLQSDPTQRLHPYMASKAAAELIARTYITSAEIAVAIVRPANIYGGGDFNWNRLVPGIIRAVLQGEPPILRSNGLLQRDYVYIEDAIAAFIAVGERMNRPEVRGQLLPIATGIGTTVLEVVKQITFTLGRPDLKPQILDKKNQERVDTFRAPKPEQKILGWCCQTSLSDGLVKTCRWYQDYFLKNKNLVSKNTG